MSTCFQNLSKQLFFKTSLKNVTQIKSENKFGEFFLKLLLFFSKLAISFQKKTRNIATQYFPFILIFRIFGEISHRKETLADRPREIRHQAVSIASTSIVGTYNVGLQLGTQSQFQSKLLAAKRDVAMCMQRQQIPRYLRTVLFIGTTRTGQ